MADEEDWRDLTCMGSAYEQQISRSGALRHRPLILRAGRRQFGEPLGHGEWRRGAPDVNLSETRSVR